MDPCECIWNHELAMRRLLSLLRQSQTACTDNECFSELPLSPGSTPTEGNSFMLMAMCWFALAVLLYFLRPQSLRNQNDSKPRNNEPDNDGQPSAPPPSIH
ncbi:small integral membrane protein 14 [Lycorma delicatula]|uniref:small integral membrane protein 14 n=1 Tax=Lycorma delicatula TaxID=130591 RepID=UPI003F510935